MSYVEKHLIDGESVVYETRLHWVVLVVPILLGLLFGLTGVAMFVLSGRTNPDQTVAHESLVVIGVAFLVIALVFIARGVLLRNATEMTVTNKRVFVKVGLAARRTIELLLSRVESIGVEESVMGRMLGYGKVIVHGTGGTPEIFNGIAHPLEFRTQVQQQIEKSQEKSR
jgi:membrane protein YdbS with pleckstrin-like domain